MLTNLAAAKAQETIATDDIPDRPRKPPRDKAERVPVTVPVAAAPRRWYAPVRRVLDFGAALTLLVFSGPLLLLAALAVRLSSRGPAFYTQTRTGRGGKPFTIYKLRTMVDNCESLTGPRWTIPGDPRITPLGWFLRRTHLDELPQLFNVIRGDMSLIGPRPERPEFVAKLERAIPGYMGRHDVLPGITGLAQVQLPPDTDTESVREKLRYDLYYVRRCSLSLDVRIALATALHMFGASFAVLRRLRLVPAPANEATEPAAPVLHRQAA